MTLSHEERIARLRLFRSETVGPITFYRLLGRFGSAVDAIKNLPTLITHAGKSKSRRIMSIDDAHDEIQNLKKLNGRMVMFGDEAYPEWLTTVEDAPPILSCMGNIDLLSQSSVAIVGARNASANAKRLTLKIAQELGEKGQVVVSGLARGLDTAAHQASLETGTIAVLAGGIDQIYPTENTDLYHAIADKGCVVSEMPFGMPPTARHFPRRNRIVSGLAKAVIVVEATTKSGSLITARLAAEQGREVMAVPGFPGDPRAGGPNQLLKEGATLIQSADDVLDELMSLDEKRIEPSQPTFDAIAEEAEIFDFQSHDDSSLTPENTYEMITQTLSTTPITVDDLCYSCHLSIQDVQICLMDLELSGVITRHPGNRVSKVS